MRAALAIVLALAVAAPAAAAGVHDPIIHKARKPLGVVVLVHAGGWAGPNPKRQADLDVWPGKMLRYAHWKTVSIDYEAGQAGLASVEAQIRTAYASAPHQRLCVYGESAGAHLALLAAADMPEIRCVIGMGTPTDLGRWRNDAVTGGSAEWTYNWSQTAEPTFGPAPEARWEPTAQARRIAQPVLLAGQADDHVLPAKKQMEAFAAVHQATETVVTDPGVMPYLHGSISAASLAAFGARIRSFVGRS